MLSSGKTLDWPILIEWLPIIRKTVILCCDPDDWQDMTQDVLVRLIERGPEFDPSRGVAYRTWLIALVRFSIVDVYRDRWGRNGQRADPWPLERAEEVTSDDDVHRHFQADNALHRYLSYLPADVEAYMVHRAKGCSREIAWKASGIKGGRQSWLWKADQIMGGRLGRGNRRKSA